MSVSRPATEASAAPLHAVVRNLLLETELHRIAQTFQRERVDFIVLKGIPLALRVFESIDSRAMVDNDILVRRADAPRALEVLQSLGYESIDCRSLEKQIDVDYQYRLARTVANGAAVNAELHWNAFPEDLYPVPEALLWEHCERFDLALPEPILVFDRPLTIVHLAAHFAVSDFAVPSILVDVARAWNRWYAESDAKEVVELAARTGLTHVLDFALLAAADLRLLRGEPPPIRSPRARRLRSFLRSEDMAGDRPAHDYARKAGAALLAEPRRIPTWLWRIAFPPIENLAVIEGRPPSRGLYLRYFTRPLRLAARMLGVMLRGAGT